MSTTQPRRVGSRHCRRRSKPQKTLFCSIIALYQSEPYTRTPAPRRALPGHAFGGRPELIPALALLWLLGMSEACRTKLPERTSHALPTESCPMPSGSASPRSRVRSPTSPAEPKSANSNRRNWRAAPSPSPTAAYSAPSSQPRSSTRPSPASWACMPSWTGPLLAKAASSSGP